MKRLMFATALAASVAAFGAAMATPTALHAIGFEGYTNLAVFVNGDTEKEENGNDKSVGPYFYFDGESNSSVVTNERPSTDTVRTAFFANETNAKYLALDTEGGTLWRSIAAIDHNVQEGTYGLGAAQTVAATGTYLDTLVQFTVTEDEAPTVGADDKLAIWLQADGNTTNLMVKAGYYNAAGTFVTEGTNFVVSGVTVTPGTWYRLTVKAIDDVVDSASEFASFYKLPVFTIQIDGTYMTASEATLASEYTSGLATSGILTSDTVSEFNNGKYFLSLKMGTPGTATTLQGVGFQGTGAVDEIVWTEDNPFPAAATIDFTLTWTASEVSAVSYVLSTDLTTTNSLTSGTAVQLAPGDGTATIELIPTFETGYEFDKVTMGETELSTLTFAIPSATATATLVAKAAATAYPTYIDTTDTAITAKYDAWKQAVGFDDSSTSTHLNQFLLNVDEETTVGDDALQIDSITEVQGGWKIVVSTTVSGAALSTGTESFAASYNGYLTVLAADTLEGLSSATGVAYPVTAIEGGKVEITVTAGKFMKVVLTTTTPAQN